MANKNGDVYIASNPAMPGLLKIGHTETNAEWRIEQLSKSTSVPLSFVLEYSVFVENSQKCEADVHRALCEHRLSRNREFFQIGLDEAIRVLNKVAFGTEDIGEASLRQITTTVRCALAANPSWTEEQHAQFVRVIVKAIYPPSQYREGIETIKKISKEMGIS